MHRAARSRRLKLVLVAMLTTGAMGSIAVPRVWAIFTAQAGQIPASVSSGTLAIDAKVGAGSACFSYNGPASPGNVNSSCTALYTYSPSTELYPGEPVTIDVAIHNDGSLNVGDLLLFLPGGCTVTATGDAAAPAQGGGNPCASGGLQVSIEEDASSGGAALKCWYPASAGACSLTGNLSTLATATSVASALDLGSGPVSGGTRFFRLGVQEPSTASNTLQGEAANFVVAWHANS
jgi:hypothetical protein